MTERFELLSQLGKGGMGVVWKARDNDTGEIVALKLLHSIYADEPDYVARFEREVEVARRIHSPHVVEVRGFGVRDGVPYMAMEYVEGPSLRELLKARGPFTWDDARPILADVAEGLAAAHAAGVIHRDVKPSNILIAPDGRAKLADFGIARAMDMTRLTGSLTTLGTPAYMAPDDVIDERSDFYSLGCVAFEMLTGAPPFEGDSMREVWLKHERTAPDLAKVPKEARAAVAGLLDKDKQRRSRGENVSTGSGVGGRPPRGNRRWRVPVALGGGSLVLVSVLMLAVWTPFCSTPPPAGTCADGTVRGRPDDCPTPTPVPRPTATDPTATPTATSTVTPTATPIPLTSTPVPPTATPRPPTATPVPPTSTPVSPTPTPTSTPIGPPPKPSLAVAVSSAAPPECGGGRFTTATYTAIFHGRAVFEGEGREVTSDGRTINAGLFTRTSEESLTWSICGPSPGSRYCWRYRTVDAYGASPYSDEVCGTP